MPLPEPVIRRATPADIPALSALAKMTFVDTFGPDGFDVGYPEADLAAFLAESYAPDRVAGWIADPAAQVLVAEAGAALVGYAHSGANTLPYAAARAEDGEVKRLYIHRDRQGSGLGRALFAEALAWLGPRPVLIGVWSENYKALGFYARHGFEKVGEYEFPVGAVRDQEFILRRAPV